MRATLGLQVRAAPAECMVQCSACCAVPWWHDVVTRTTRCWRRRALARARVRAAGVERGAGATTRRQRRGRCCADGDRWEGGRGESWGCRGCSVCSNSRPSRADRVACDGNPPHPTPTHTNTHNTHTTLAPTHLTHNTHTTHTPRGACSGVGLREARAETRRFADALPGQLRALQERAMGSPRLAATRRSSHTCTTRRPCT